MESHEERLHNMIKQSKVESAKDQARVAATTIRERRDSVQMEGIAGGGGMGGMGGMGGGDGYGGDSRDRGSRGADLTLLRHQCQTYPACSPRLLADLLLSRACRLWPWGVKTSPWRTHFTRRIS